MDVHHWDSVGVFLSVLRPDEHPGSFMFGNTGGKVDLAALEAESKASLACPMECSDCQVIGGCETGEETGTIKLLLSLEGRRKEDNNISIWVKCRCM